jgi:UTP--glucose-1-phosphate uridylyltransferase
MRKITKAVIAAAGYGTRFLPATKNQPKEMLPIIDKPIIHYLVEEAVKSGIKDIIIVTRAGQMPLEDYFDSHAELERAGKKERLKQIKDIPKMANFVYVRQNADLPYGNATPLLCVKPLIDDDESFVYMFGDDLTISEIPVTKQLIDVYEKEEPSAVLAVQEVPDEEVERYGTVKYKKGSNEIEAIKEKLPFGEAPSNMAQFGRFVLSYDVVEMASKTSLGKGNELWVTDILNDLAQAGKKVIAQPIEGRWLTTGDPLRYLKASVEFALERDDIGKPFREYLKTLK